MSFDELKAAIATRDAFKATIFSAREKLEGEFKEAILDAARRRAPRRKLDFSKACKILGDEMKEIVAPFQKRANELINEQSATRARLDDDVRRFAEVLMPRPGPNAFVLESIYRGAYSSQGFGADRYGIGRAEIYNEAARALGIETRVDVDDCNYKAIVLVVDECDVEIIKAHPLSIKEWIRACWRRQLQPRVFNSFLPFDLEAKLGIDYQGNDKV